jgi:hypothetical protein
MRNSTTAYALLWRCLRQDPWICLGLAALATLPTEFLGDYLGWTVVDPGSALSEAAWIPVATLCELALLRRMGILLNPDSATPALRGALLRSAIGAEFLIGLRLCVVVLLWSIPALVVLSAMGLEGIWGRILFGCLACLAAWKSVQWALRRMLSPCVVLWQGLPASQALDESDRLCRGNLGSILGPVAVLMGFPLILQLLSGDSILANALVLPLSTLMSCAATAWAYGQLTQA